MGSGKQSAKCTSSFELKATVLSNTNSEIFNNASEMCVGLFSRIGKEITQTLFCGLTNRKEKS
jgi:hypothetical protein